MDAASNVFQVNIGSVVVLQNVELSFAISTNDGNEIVGKDININVIPTDIITAIYGGSSQDYFTDVAIDSSGNIYAVGSTASEGSGNTDALIVKFDSSLNKLAGKIYGGANGDIFYGASIDSSGNIYAVGITNSEGTGGEALIIKFDSSLNKLAGKRYGGTGNDEFVE